MQEAPGDLPGPTRRIGPYELVSEIGRGGMGVVYLARQTDLDRLVALKILPGGRYASSNDVERFEREARAAARVHHDNLVAIHDVGQADDCHYYSMEYVPGPSLSRILRDGPLAPRRAAQLVLQAARGVAAAHEAGIVHRDIKPSNILVAPGDRARVVDFGLAKPIEGDSDLTVSGALVGTPIYMPPEQSGATGSEVGPWSDVYSLGATLYEALAGRPPYEFQGPDAVAIAQMLFKPPVPLRDRASGLPRDIETIVEKAMEKDETRRYPDAAALADDLERFLEFRPIVARRPAAARRLTLWARRRPLAATVVAVALGVVTAGGILAALKWMRHERSLAAVAEGDRALDSGDPEAAIERYLRAIDIEPGNPEALRRRSHAVVALASLGEGRVAEHRLADAQSLLDWLRTAIPDPDGRELRVLAGLEREIAESRALELAGERGLAEDLASAKRADPAMLSAAGARLADRLERLRAPQVDPAFADRARPRIAIAARSLLVAALVERDDATADLLARVVRDAAGQAESGVGPDLAARVDFEALSDDWSGTGRPMGGVVIHVCRLRPGGWSGDQEEAVLASLEGPGSTEGLRLDPGTHLCTLSAPGHFPVRLLVPALRAARIRVRVRLFAERELGMEVRQLPRIDLAIEDALEPPAPTDSPRARFFASCRAICQRLAETADAFAARTELTNLGFARIYPAPPRPSWAPTGWDPENWGNPDGEEELPVRGVSQHHARAIAREATLRLLPADLRGRWRYSLPSNDPGDPGSTHRLGGDPIPGLAVELFLPQQDRTRWPVGAFGNLGSGRVAPAGIWPVDVSIEGCLDVYGNVSEWTMGRASTGGGSESCVRGGNYRYRRDEENESLREAETQRADAIGVRLVLVPARGEALDVPVTAILDSTSANRIALDVLAGDPDRGIAGDPFQARFFLESYLERDPDHVRTRLNAAMVCLAEHEWADAVRHADLVVAKGPPDAALLARWIRVWSNLMIDRSGVGEPDVERALSDLGHLGAEGRENTVLRLGRGYFLLRAGRVTEVLREIEPMVPPLYRLARFERHLGLEDMTGALVERDPNLAFRSLVGRRLVAIAEVPRLDGEVVPLDVEFLDRAGNSGSVVADEFRDRWRKTLLASLKRDVLDDLLAERGLEGESPPATLARFAGLLARLVAFTGRKKDAQMVLTIASALGSSAGATDSRALAESLRTQADLSRFWKELDQAEAFLEKALEIVPDDPDLLAELAWCRLEGALEEPQALRESALEDARRLLERARMAPDAQLYLAILLLEEGRGEEARAAFEALTLEHPDDPALWVYLGEARRRSGERLGAHECWDRARKLDPSYRPLVESLSERP